MCYPDDEKVIKIPQSAKKSTPKRIFSFSPALMITTGLEMMCNETGMPMPQNMNLGNSMDLLLRKLDCAVIETMHKINKLANKRPYDSVKGEKKKI